MFRNLAGMTGWTVAAADGDIGTVKGFMIDENGWTVRYMTVECDPRISRGNVRIAASSFLQPAGTGRFPVRLSREQVRLAPGPGTYDVRQASADPRPSRGTAVKERTAAERVKSAGELQGYRVVADDGEIGGLAGLVVDDINWQVYYLLVDAGAILPGRTVALAAAWAGRADDAARRIPVDVSRQKVADSPACDVSRPIDRQFEEALFRHYGMPPYWRR